MIRKKKYMHVIKIRINNIYEVLGTFYLFRPYGNVWSLVVDFIKFAYFMPDINLLGSRYLLDIFCLYVLLLSFNYNQITSYHNDIILYRHVSLISSSTHLFYGIYYLGSK